MPPPVSAHAMACYRQSWRPPDPGPFAYGRQTRRVAPQNSTTHDSFISSLSCCISFVTEIQTLSS